MKRLLLDRMPKKGTPVTLSTEETHHAKAVLRLSNGTELEVLDGAGHRAQGRLRFDGKNAFIEYMEEPKLADPREVAPVTLLLSVLKGDAMEWAIEKCVELGLETFVPIITERSVVQMDRKGPEIFQERWQRIADQALKQCGRAYRMKVELPLSLADATAKLQRWGDKIFFCDEAEKSSLLWDTLTTNENNFNKACILIGPEGGWTDEERRLLASTKAESISLGLLILRAETAAISSTALLTAHLTSARLKRKHD
jgi:16S rRNA (uracil1498-N3)-methyltransferase